MGRAAILDYDPAGGVDVDSLVPLGLVAVTDGGGLELLYTEAAVDEPHPRYRAMAMHLEALLEDWRNNGTVIDWSVPLTRMVEMSYPGLRWRVPVDIPDGVTNEEAFERYVLGREDPPVPADDDPRWSDSYFR